MDLVDWLNIFDINIAEFDVSSYFFYQNIYNTLFQSKLFLGIKVWHMTYSKWNRFNITLFIQFVDLIIDIFCSIA